MAEVLSSGILNDNGEQFTGQIDYDEIAIRYRVETDGGYDNSADMIKDAVFGRFLPGVGTLLRDDLPYKCISLDASLLGDGGCVWWIAEATFSSQLVDLDTWEDPARQDPEFPEKDGPVYSIVGRTFKFPFHFDMRQASTINSAGDLITPIVEQIGTIVSISVQWKTRKNYNLAKLNGSTNNSQLYVPVPRAITPENADYRPAGKFFTVNPLENPEAWLWYGVPSYTGFVTNASTIGPKFRRIQPDQVVGGNGLPVDREYYENKITIELRVGGTIDENGDDVPDLISIDLLDPKEDFKNIQNFRYWPHPSAVSLMANVGFRCIRQSQNLPPDEWDPTKNYVIGDTVEYKLGHYAAVKDNINEIPDKNPDNWAFTGYEHFKKRINYADVAFPGFRDRIPGAPENDAAEISEDMRGILENADDWIDQPAWLTNEGDVENDQTRFGRKTFLWFGTAVPEDWDSWNSDFEQFSFPFISVEDAEATGHPMFDNGFPGGDIQFP